MLLTPSWVFFNDLLTPELSSVVHKAALLAGGPLCAMWCDCFNMKTLADPLTVWQTAFPGDFGGGLGKQML